VPVRFGFALGTYGWLGADAIWTSFPVSSFSTWRWPSLSTSTAAGGRAG
jgi:hypothetical protein